MITYLCGGINKLTDSECKDWRSIAKSLLKTDILDPMRRDYRGKEKNNYQIIVDGDLIDIDNSNFLLVNACKPSWGTAMEIFYAAQNKKVIIAFTDDIENISPWLMAHCTKIVASLQEAVQEINLKL